MSNKRDLAKQSKVLETQVASLSFTFKTLVRAGYYSNAYFLPLFSFDCCRTLAPAHRVALLGKLSRLLSSGTSFGSLLTPCLSQTQPKPARLEHRLFLLEWPSQESWSESYQFSSAVTTSEAKALPSHKAIIRPALCQVQHTEKGQEQLRHL